MYAGNNPVNLVDSDGEFPHPFTVAAGIAVGAAAGAGATYVGDVISDIHRGDYAGALLPNSSWKTYLANTAQGATVGGFCAAFFETGVACVGLATAGSSLIRQAVEKGTLDPRELNFCEAAVEGGFAAVGTAGAKGVFPRKVVGRYPLWHNAAFYSGKHAKREYAIGAIGLPFAVAGTVLRDACGAGGPPKE